MTNVMYEKNALIITIPTSSPESLHGRLLKAISIALRLCLLTRDRRRNDLEELATIIDLQDAMVFNGSIA
jgi:DUF917 family protein